MLEYIRKICSRNEEGASAVEYGLLVAGIFGALIAVPVIACANVAGTYLSRRHQGRRPPEPDTRRHRAAVANRR